MYTTCLKPYMYIEFVWWGGIKEAPRSQSLEMTFVLHMEMTFIVGCDIIIIIRIKNLIHI